MNIGLFGGTFDPIHNGHLCIAEAAVKSFDLTTLFFVPAFSPPHKRTKAITDYDLRCKWIAAAIQDHPTLQISDVEKELGGTSYTVYTVAEFRRRFPEDRLHLVIGMDMLEDFPNWRNPQKILTEVARIVIFPRKGYNLQHALRHIEEKLGEEAASWLAKSVLEMLPVDISSTEVRRRVQSDEDISALVPTAILDSVTEHFLWPQALRGYFPHG